jgi:hypothetical protein
MNSHTFIRFLHQLAAVQLELFSLSEDLAAVNLLGGSCVSRPTR